MKRLLFVLAAASLWSCGGDSDCENLAQENKSLREQVAVLEKALDAVSGGKNGQSSGQNSSDRVPATQRTQQTQSTSSRRQESNSEDYQAQEEKTVTRQKVAAPSASGLKAKKYTVMGIYNEYKECKSGNSSKNSCREYTAKAVCGLYGITDFMKGQNKYMSIEEVNDHVRSSSKWQKIGKARQQTVLDIAHKKVQKGTPVVAIASKDQGGGVAMLLKGPMVKSGSWKLNCPNSMCFIINKPQLSYHDKVLSYAWTRPIGVDLYYRKK